MRSISISTEVFAKIWAQRADGEEDEDTILKRLLGVAQPTHPTKRTGENVSPVQAHLWRDDVKAGLESLGRSEEHTSELQSH